MTRLTNRCTLSALAILVGMISTSVRAQAQSPAAGAYEPALTLARAEFRFSDLLAHTASNKLHPVSAGSNLSQAAGGFHKATVPFFNITPAAAGIGLNLPVLGGGTLGRLTKWSGFTSSNSFLGDTTIFEDKYGNVGVGTDSPTSRLTVSGMVEASLGGYKFPDGTVQATSAAGALLSVAHNATLEGNGTEASPLQVASPLDIRDQDNPARQPFQASVDCSTALADCGASVATPGGKRLVVEYLTLAAAMTANEVANCSVTTTAAARIVGHTLPLSPPAVVIRSGPAWSTLGLQVRLYADPGSAVRLSCARSGFGGVATFFFSISGHLVDLP